MADRTPSSRTSSGNWPLGSGPTATVFTEPGVARSNPAIGEHPPARTTEFIYSSSVGLNKGPLVLPAINQKILAAAARTGGDLRLEQSETHITLDLPSSRQHPIVTVVELTVSGRALDIPPLSVPAVNARNKPEIGWVVSRSARCQIAGEKCPRHVHVTTEKHRVTDVREAGNSGVVRSEFCPVQRWFHREIGLFLTGQEREFHLDEPLGELGKNFPGGFCRGNGFGRWIEPSGD